MPSETGNDEFSKELMHLAEREVELLEELRKQGATEEVFDENALIHHQYSLLAERGSIEALKRALFIQWYRVAEPAFFSGINGLSSESVNKVFTITEDRINKGDLDDELIWMLAYYYGIAEYYLKQSKKKWPKLVKVSIENQDKSWPPPDEAALTNRGQMSKYWQSILDSHRRHADR